jgi:hypothetical protein
MHPNKRLSFKPIKNNFKSKNNKRKENNRLGSEVYLLTSKKDKTRREKRRK